MVEIMMKPKAVPIPAPLVPAAIHRLARSQLASPTPLSRSSLLLWCLLRPARMRYCQPRRTGHLIPMARGDPRFRPLTFQGGASVDKRGF